MTAGWIAFLAYSAVAIAVGIAAARRRRLAAVESARPAAAERDYWTAGRSLSAASVGLSISAGFLSVSWSCVYAVQLFYWYGLGGVWLITVPWLITLVAIFLLADRYRTLPAFSQPEMVGARFGRRARGVVAVALAFVFLVWGGAEIYVAATLLAPELLVSPSTLVLLIGLVVAVYSMLGGFQAVVDTDKLQFGIVVLYLCGVAALAAYGLGAVGGASGAMSGDGVVGAAVSGAKSDVPWTDLLAPGWALVALTLVAYLPGWIFETDLWLRVQAARDRGAARRGVALAALVALLFVGVVPGFIGVAALQLYPVEDGAFPPAVGNEGDAILAALVRDFAPAWLAGLLAVGLVAAAMSTIDTCTNVVALSVAYDLLGIGAPTETGSAGHSSFGSRAVTVASVAAACAFALGIDSLWDIFYLSSGVLTTAVAFPVAAVFSRRVLAPAVTGSAAAGLVGTATAYFLETRGLLAPVEPAWLAASGVGFVLWGLVAALVGGLAGQWVGIRSAAGTAANAP